MAVAGTHKYMKQHGDRHVAVEEKHTLYGDSTITLMKHINLSVTPPWSA